MKTAIIKTDFWKEDQIFGLLPDVRLFYLCLLTNPERNTTRVFQCSDRLMVAYTGYSKDTIDMCKEHLKKAGLVEIVDNYYILSDQQCIEPKRGKLTKDIEDDFIKTLPDNILKKLNSSSRASSREALEYNNINNNTNINSKENITNEITEVYDFFISCFHRNPKQYKLSIGRINKIKARLNDAGKEMLMLAIEKSAKTPFYTGANDRKWKADLDFITRSYEKVEQLSNLEVSGNLKYDNKPRKPQPKPIIPEKDKVEISPEEAEKNRIILDLVRAKKVSFSDMKTLKSKSVADLRAML